MNLIMGLVGMATLVLIAVLFSSNRKAIKIRTVAGAFAIQAGLGAFVLYVPVGRDILVGVSDAVSSVIGYGQNGIEFLFGGLVSNKMFEVFGGGGFIFAFRVLPVIIFFSSLIAVLYYLGIMQWVIKLLGGGLQKVLGTSRTESLSATANIFVGQTEAPLVVRPFISKMTDSELFAVMCGGLASVAGSVLAGYASMGVKMEYLIAASFMAAPGGLLFAKLLVPETETPSYDENNADGELEDKPANVIDAAAAGASAGLQLALNVGAMLLAFIGLIAMINGIFSGVGGWFGYPQLSLELLLGWIFSPLAFLIGVFVNACVAGLYAIAPVVYGSDVRATGVGWGIGIGRIGAIVSPLVAGGLLDAAWSPDQLYLGYGLAFVLAAVIVSMHRIAGPQAADRRAASETVAAAH